jgi:hypothetical protein
MSAGAPSLSWTEVKSLFYKPGSDFDETTGGGKKDSNVRCWNCGQTGHTDLHCPIARRCYVCLLDSHEAHQCTENPAPGSVVFNRKEVCAICGLRGHGAARCKSEGGPLHRRAGLNASNQVVFSKPLVIRVQEDNGPPTSKVNQARNAIVTLLERKTEKIRTVFLANPDGRLNLFAAPNPAAFSPNGTALPQDQSTASQSQFNMTTNLSGNFAGLSRSASTFIFETSEMGNGKKESSANFGMLTDLDLYRLASRVCTMPVECGVSERELRALKANVEVLRRVVSTVGLGINPKAGSHAEEGTTQSSAATFFQDENMLHELKASNLDFHVVFGGRVEQYMRAKGAEMESDSGKYQPVGGAIKPPEVLMQEFRYNPMIYGPRGQRKVGGQGAAAQQQRGNVKSPLDSSDDGFAKGKKSINSKTELLSYALAGEPSQSPRRLEEAKTRLRQASDTNTFIPQPPSMNSRRTVSTQMVRKWANDQRVQQSPRTVRSIRLKDTAFTKEMTLHSQRMPESWTSNDVTVQLEALAAQSDFHGDVFDLLPLSALAEPTEPEDGSGGTAENEIFLTTLGSMMEGAFSGVMQSHPESTSVDGRNSTEPGSTPSETGSRAGLPRTGSARSVRPGTSRIPRPPSAAVSQGEPPIKNWDVFCTLRYVDDAKSAKRDLRPNTARVNAESFVNGELEEGVPIVVNPLDVEKISSRWAPRFHSAKIQRGFQTTEQLSARSSLRRIASSSYDQLSTCAEIAMGKGRQWSVAHGMVKDLKHSRSPSTNSGQSPSPSPANSTRRKTDQGSRAEAPDTTDSHGPSSALSIGFDAIRGGIWTHCCLQMAERAAQKHQRQYLYQNLRTFATKIRAPHTHQGHQFLNAFVEELAEAKTDLTPALVERVVARCCPADPEKWTVELSDIVSYLRLALPEVC